MLLPLRKVKRHKGLQRVSVIGSTEPLVDGTSVIVLIRRRKSASRDGTAQECQGGKADLGVLSELPTGAPNQMKSFSIKTKNE